VLYEVKCAQNQTHDLFIATVMSLALQQHGTTKPKLTLMVTHKRFFHHHGIQSKIETKHNRQIWQERRNKIQIYLQS